MEFRAIIHNLENGLEKLESIWFDTKDEAEKAGTEGLLFYGGTNFTIEERVKH